jgi:hypothetical protein
VNEKRSEGKPERAPEPQRDREPRQPQEKPEPEALDERSLDDVMRECPL